MEKERNLFHFVSWLLYIIYRPLPLFHNNFSRFRNLKIDVFLQLLRVCEWGGLAKSLSKISLKSSSKQTDYEKFSSLWTKIWHCVEMFCRVEFSNFLLGQKFVTRSNSKMQRLVPRRPILRRAPTSTHAKRHQPVSHIILNGSMHKWNPASGILNELSDCIL